MDPILFILVIFGMIVFISGGKGKEKAAKKACKWCGDDHDESKCDILLYRRLPILKAEDAEKED